MQRIASVAIVSLFVLVVGTGCSLFGKKSTPAADTYDPTLDSTAQQGAYPTPYQSLAAEHSAPTSAGGGRYHTVQKKESLYSIARLYYNDQAKWKDIYQANHSDISDPNKIRVGQRLVIP